MHFEIFDTGVTGFYFLSARLGADHRFLSFIDNRFFSNQVRSHSKIDYKRNINYDL